MFYRDFQMILLAEKCFDERAYWLPEVLAEKRIG
jgi:hypothetical protein